ncbi:hypothetical protein Pelo_16361 [Pelomyxa schiedti]|nr:hypothetical protein Pelo_16361 [Pelomyxa schiedti]
MSKNIPRRTNASFPSICTNSGHCNAQVRSIYTQLHIPAKANAHKYYLAASEKGHSSSQICLGLMYKDGYGVKKNEEEAVRWFQKSCEQENSNTARQTLFKSAECSKWNNAKAMAPGGIRF